MSQIKIYKQANGTKGLICLDDGKYVFVDNMFKVKNKKGKNMKFKFDKKNCILEVKDANYSYTEVSQLLNNLSNDKLIDSIEITYVNKQTYKKKELVFYTVKLFMDDKELRIVIGIENNRHIQIYLLPQQDKVIGNTILETILDIIKDASR